MDPAAARLLTYARLKAGWSYLDAAYALGVSERYVRYLEAGQRVPSTVIGDRLIEVYDLDNWDSELIRSVALPDVGRASPFRTRPKQQQRAERAAARAAADLAPLLVQVEVAALASDLPRGVRPSPFA